MVGFIQVSTATESRAAAEKLARSVVEARLAAGAQIIGPVVSAYWHLGEFGTGEEWQLLLKTRDDRYAALEAHLVEHHPWKNPEISAVPIVSGSESYLGWIRRNTELELDA
ncbi:MAG: divalent-cation tolerance protein CutA [Micromonosporaceae bacterium]